MDLSELFTQGIEKNFLYEDTYKIIKEAIVSGAIKPGDRIIESQLAESLKMSRTPIREALARLKNEGLIYRSMDRKLTVCQMSEQDMNELFDLRIVLEKYCGKLACINITEFELVNLKKNIEATKAANKNLDYEKIIDLNTKFHDIIAKASHNYRLMSLLSNLREHIYRYRVVVIRNEKEITQSLEGHIEIYNALKNKEIDKIEFIVEKYILLAKESVVKEMEHLRSITLDIE